MATKTGADIQALPDDRKQELVTRFRLLLEKKYQKALAKCVEGNPALDVDFSVLDKFSPEMADILLSEPEKVFEIAEEAVNQIYADLNIKVRFFNIPEDTNIRDLRSKHIGKFVSVEGTVRRASEIRPEIMATMWECEDCGDVIRQPRKGAFISRPWQCSCGKKDFKQVGSEKIDSRWLTIEEPFELTEGDRPSQVTIFLSEDLVSPEGRRNSDPGNRLKITGVLRDVPRGKAYSVKLDFYLDANHVQPTEIGWAKLEITKEDEEEIKRLASNDNIYEMFVDSLAPSLYGLREIKESIIMQLFGGVPRTLKDGVHLRGDIHILLIGDPACLIGDERVFLGNGTTTKIQNLGTRHMQNIHVPVRIKGNISDTATTFHIYNNQPVIEIITESGKNLKGSYNQPVLVVEGIERKWKRLDELEIGDRVAVVPSVQCRKKSLVPTGWKKMDRKFGPRFYGRIPDNWDIRLGALIGYMLGDGYVRVKKGEMVAVVNKDESDLIKILTRYIKDLFGLEPVVEARKVADHEYQGRTIRSKNKLYQIVFRSKDLAENLKFIREKRVPDPIFLSPNSVVKEFLKWLFQADGSVFSRGRGKRSVQLKQKEIELLRDVQMLLLRFGIHSRIYGNNLTIRRGYDILKFAKHIGFASRNKTDKLLELSAEAKNFKRAKRQLSEEIMNIKRLKGTQTVYDIEVPKSKRFIANGIIVHNSGKSQLLKLVPEIVPRGRYVSGKGVTSAGLTATVTKDEQFMGGWVLEAGAMVLANKGLLSIDEFEKMSQDDQVAMHEALEQGSVSIAKASIVATLPARTSVLAGGNPKFSRFDPYMAIAKQITIPDTLLSRFDLKFALRDVPDSETDKLVVDHILKSRHDDYEATIPKLSSKFIRKYVAYARDKCKPDLTEEAEKILKNFYIKTRKKAEGATQAIPITLRQFEALMRISEASAKIQLSHIVRKEDAQRAIKLMRYSLRQLGLDPETGQIDVDRVEGATTSSERSRIRIVLDIINDISSVKKEIHMEEIRSAARKEGIEDVDEIIEKLKREGMLFEPSPGYVQKV